MVLNLLCHLVLEALTRRRRRQLRTWEMTAKVACLAHFTDVLVIGAGTSHVVCINIESSKHVAHLPLRL